MEFEIDGMRVSGCPVELFEFLRLIEGSKVVSAPEPLVMPERPDVLFDKLYDGSEIDPITYTDCDLSDFLVGFESGLTKGSYGAGVEGGL